jgi:hypothetical protein
VHLAYSAKSGPSAAFFVYAERRAGGAAIFRCRTVPHRFTARQGGHENDNLRIANSAEGAVQTISAAAVSGAENNGATEPFSFPLVPPSE